jgi:acyl-CoA thioesterase-2
MNANTQALLDLLNLEQTSELTFRGLSPATLGRQVFGGQAIAQALVAAQRTAPADRPVHSLHAYFVLAGDKRIPIDYTVERVRDGKSFTTRRCIGMQNDRAIFTLEASFQIVEEGFDRARHMPRVPAPETLPTTGAIIERLRYFLPPPATPTPDAPQAVDIRIVDPRTMAGASHAAGKQYVWFNIARPIPDDPTVHSALLAYISDMTLMSTAVAALGRTICDPTLQVASLDHAMWFHRPFRADGWLLYAQESPTAARARGLSRGEFFSREGVLIASVAQEGLIRPRTPNI